MLLHEDCGRRQNRHLLAVPQCLEGRSHGDLGLTEADITADQPVHRAVGLHVPLDVANRLELIRGLGVLEGVFEYSVRGIGVAVRVITSTFWVSCFTRSL